MVRGKPDTTWSGESRTRRLVAAARLGARLVPDVLQVLQILVVFVTRHFEELVLLPFDREGDGPGTRLDGGTRNGRFVLDRIGINRREPFNDARGVALDFADLVQPRLP